MFDSKPIVQRLKSYRKEHEITQGDLAKRLSVTEPALSKWLNGRTDFNPTLKQLLNMAEMFGVSLIELFSQESDAASTPVEDGVEKAKKTSKRTQKTQKAKTSTKAKASTVSSPDEKKQSRRTVKTSSAVKGAKAKANTKSKAEKTARKVTVTKTAKPSKEPATKKRGRPRKSA